MDRNANGLDYGLGPQGAQVLFDVSAGPHNLILENRLMAVLVEVFPFSPHKPSTPLPELEGNRMESATIASRSRRYR
jgi:hypothetical protein